MKRIEKLELFSSMLRYFLERRKSLSTKPAGFSLMLSPVEVLVLVLFTIFVLCSRESGVFGLYKLFALKVVYANNLFPFLLFEVMLHVTFFLYVLLEGLFLLVNAGNRRRGGIFFFLDMIVILFMS